MDRFYGFYVGSQLFWVEQALVLEDKSKCDRLESMSALVLSHSTDDYSLHVCRDGMLVLTIESMERRHREVADRETDYGAQYLNYANCIVLLFESTLTELGEPHSFAQELTAKDLIWVEPVDGRFSAAAWSSGSESELFLHTNRFGSLPPPGHERRIERPVVSRGVFTKFFKRVDRVFEEHRMVLSMAQLMTSLSHYRTMNRETSLVLSWFIIEAFLRRKWERWLDAKNQQFEDGSKRINAARRESLGSGRDYPISVVSNVLELSGEISFALFDQIDRVRRIRNKIVHQKATRECTSADCRLALQIAISLMREELGFPLNLDLASQVYWWGW